MVRTLVFQSSNVGSIPAGPTINFNFQTKLQLTKLNNTQLVDTSKTHNVVTYNFQFISLVAPLLINNLRLATIGSNRTSNSKLKLLMKQSYLILTWFYYLTFSTTSGTKSTNSISFAFLPRKSKSYTLTKAPMAQKTRSKEQFNFKFYVLKITIQTHLNNDFSLKSVDQTLLALLVAKYTFPIFETNLLFLKTYTLNVKFLDATYFNYHYFLTKR